MIDHITIDAGMFRAVALCASSEETRYYLRGVALQVRDGQARIVATDGHRLMIHSFETHFPGDVGIIIPIEAIKRAFTGWKKAWERILVQGSGRDWKIGDVAFAPIDGTFPDYSRVFPNMSDGSAGVVAQFNPAYIGDMGKAGKFFGERPTIHHFGESPALVTFGDRGDVLGLIMPLRGAPRTTADLKMLIEASLPLPAKQEAAA